MTQFLRGKQTGIQNDLSSGLTPELFALDHVARYGINSQIGALAYDPVQSLLAVGTNESQYGGGQVYVFGQKRVCVTLAMPKRSSIKLLQFCADKLVVLDSKNDILFFSLETRRLLTTYSPPGQVTALLTDPTLDYALVGLQNGDILAYDLDRQGLAPFRISNLWKERNPRAKLVAVVSLSLHPRDIGSLLIGYSEGAVIFSFKQNKPLSFLEYEPPRGGQASAVGSRLPKLVHAIWHPTGTFVLTGYDDSRLVIWDPKNSKVILARMVEEGNLRGHESGRATTGSTPGTISPESPLFRISWCSKPNPDDTGILVAGGTPMNAQGKGLTFLDLGPTPVYATSSWQVLSTHFEKPKSQHLLPTPPNTEIVDFCVIPRKSPHYAGCHDPIAVIALLSSGELVTLSFPSGHPITPTNQLHADLTFVHPFVNRISVASVERTRWLGMKERRSQGPPILTGGAEATRPMKRFQDRNVLQTAHADGTIRIWDSGHGDEIENDGMLQVDVTRALGRTEDAHVLQMSISGATGELAVGVRTGEVIVFRYDQNHTFGQEPGHLLVEELGLKNIVGRAEPSVKQGLLPLTLLAKPRGPVTALKLSDVGFVVAGFQDGSVVVIDLRGPAVIYEASLHDFSKPSSRGSIRGSSSAQVPPKTDWATVIEFGVMSLEGEDYSSILFFVGTEQGRFVTFKVLPQPQGSYAVQMSGVASVDDKVISISPLVANSGKPAYASQNTVAGLRNGLVINGVVLVVTQAGAKIFKPAVARGVSKTWHDVLCYSASVVRDDDRGCGLVALFGDGSIRTYSIPGLKEIASLNVGKELDVRRLSEAVITPTGDMFAWTGPSEITVLNPWGSGQDTTKSLDRLYNAEALIPPRPTISNIQWISGTQHVTPSDLDVLIGGPDRPPSKRMIEQLRSEEQQRRNAERSPGAVAESSSSGKDEGYWAYMQRQMQERTERLDIMGDSMDKLEEQSTKWSDDVGKFVSQQKKKAVLGLIGSKFGF